MLPHLLAFALSAATLAGAVATPAAHAAWAPPTTLAQPAAENVAAAGNAAGAELLTWRVTTTRRVTIAGRTGFASFIRARPRAANRVLGAARAVSSTRELVAAPAVALDGAGNAIVVWSQAGRSTRIMGSYAPRGGRFSGPFEIGRTTAFLGARPSIAVNARGIAVVAWNGGSRVQIARRPAARCRPGHPSGCFQRPQLLPRGSDQTVALTPGGTAFVVYSATSGIGAETRTQLRLAVAPQNGLFGPTRAIPGPGQASQPSLALSSNGSAVIAWRGSPPTGGEQDADGPILVTVRDALGRLVGPVVASQLPGSRPQLRINGSGEAIVAWDGRNPTPQNPDGAEVVVAVRPASGGAFGAPLTINPPGTAAAGASLALDANGTATLAYSASLLGAGTAAGPIVAVAQRRPAGGTFAPAELLPPDFAGAFVFTAGARVTAVSAGRTGGRTALSDYAG